MPGTVRLPKVKKNAQVDKPIKISGGKVTIEDTGTNIFPEGLTVGDIKRGAQPLPKDTVGLRKVGQYIKKINFGTVVLANQNITATDKGKGWIHVELNEPRISFNVRKKWFNKTLRGNRKFYSDGIDKHLLHEWERTTVYGKQFSVENHLKGMVKACKANGDYELADEIQRIIDTHDPKKMKEAWDTIYNEMPDLFDEDYFYYEDGDVLDED